MGVARRRVGLEAGTRHSVLLRRNHDRDRGVVSGDRLIGGLAVVGAVGRDLLDRRFDLFKQQTAYAMFNRDWSSDVCSPISIATHDAAIAVVIPPQDNAVPRAGFETDQIGRASCRERV